MLPACPPWYLTATHLRAMCLAIAAVAYSVQKRGVVRGGRASFARFRACVSLHLVQEKQCGTLVQTSFPYVVNCYEMEQRERASDRMKYAKL